MIRKATLIPLCLGTLLAGIAAANGPVGDAAFGVASQGVLVPGVYFNGAQETSAVGLTNLCPQEVSVYWAFATENDEVTDRGFFLLGTAETRPFVLAQELGTTSRGRIGVIAFASDSTRDGELRKDDAPCLVAEAFHADLAAQDAAYLPVWPFNATDIAPLPLFPPPPAGIGDLSRLDPSALTTLHSGVVDPPGPTTNEAYVRYSITGSDTTRLVIWSAEDISGDHTIYATANGDLGPPAGFQLHLGNPHLNFIDLGVVSGFPFSNANGLLIIRTPEGYPDLQFDGNGLAIYSVIHSPGIGAAQTIPATAESGPPSP